MTLSMAAVGTKARVFWTPKDLGSTTLVGWYDANDTATITLSGSAVSQWDDKSGNANHATQATGANQPSYASNRITFDGSNDYLAASGVSMSSTSRCIALVMNGSTSTSAVQTVIGSTNRQAYALRTPGNNTKIEIAKTYTIDFAVGPTMTRGSDIVLVANITSSAWQIRQNGSETSGSHSQTFTSGRTMRIGDSDYADNNVKTPYNGSVREIIVTSELTTANQQRLEGYLAWKWSLVSSLPSDHPYKSVAP